MFEFAETNLKPLMWCLEAGRRKADWKYRIGANGESIRFLECAPSIRGSHLAAMFCPAESYGLVA